MASSCPEGDAGLVYEILNYTNIQGLAAPKRSTHFSTDSKETLMENVGFHIAMSSSISSFLTIMPSSILKKTQETMDS